MVDEKTKTLEEELSEAQKKVDKIKISITERDENKEYFVTADRGIVEELQFEIDDELGREVKYIRERGISPAEVVKNENGTFFLYNVSDKDKILDILGEDILETFGKVKGKKL